MVFLFSVVLSQISLTRPAYRRLLESQRIKDFMNDAGPASSSSTSSAGADPETVLESARKRMSAKLEVFDRAFNKKHTANNQKSDMPHK
jgi:hypothetical protein